MAKRTAKARREAPRVDAQAGPDRRWRRFVLSAILGYCFLLFVGTTDHQFVNRDLAYITENPLIREFSLQGFARILTTPVIGMYNPMPFLVYAAHSTHRDQLVRRIVISPSTSS